MVVCVVFCGVCYVQRITSAFVYLAKRVVFCFIKFAFSPPTTTSQARVQKKGTTV